MVTTQLKTELAQIHEDIERSRENAFGAKLFEAFVGEFLASPYSDHTTAKKFKNILEARETELEAARTQLLESKEAVKKATKRAMIAESESKRSVVMTELLSPLRGERRAVMESMLAGVPTENLRTSFDHLIKVVGSKPVAKPQPKTLNESSKLVTGDHRKPTLVESVSEKPSEDQADESILRLALVKR